MFSSDSPEAAAADIEIYIKQAREQVLENLEKLHSIDPKDWSTIDRIMSVAFQEVLTFSSMQIKLLMECLLKNGVDISPVVHTELLRQGVHTVMLASILKAHFEVVQETGRSANDAHLHLQRVRRCADSESMVAVQVFTVIDESRRNPDPPN